MRHVLPVDPGVPGTASGLRLRALLTALALFCLPALPGSAQADAVYVVRGVAVDVTAESVGEARRQALQQGEQQALELLFKRMTLKADHDRLPALSDAERAELVQDFSVADEKSSAVRYLANLTYRFHENDVRRTLRALDIPFAETRSKPVLVLPVLQRAGATLLWDDPNPWLEAWRGRPEENGLVPVLVPLGDLADIGAIGAEQALAGDLDRLTAAAARYEAGAAAVAHAVLRFDPARARDVLDVTLTRHNITLDPQISVVSFEALEGETADALLARAAAGVMQVLEDNWKRDNLIDSSRRDAIAVSIPIATLPDWLAIQQRLANVSVVRETELVLFSRGEVQIILHYIGDIGQLILAMEQADLALQGQGDGWTLSQITSERGS